MRWVAATIALAWLGTCPALAQQPVSPVYQVCSNATGVQVCSWVPLAGTNGAVLTRPSGSAGVDYSANKIALPNVGANFGGSGPYAGYVLIGTIPAGIKVPRVQNLSICPVLVLQDDGTAALGAQPANASLWVLNPAAAPGMGGNGYAPPSDNGRDQVYTAPACATSTLITIHKD